MEKLPVSEYAHILGKGSNKPIVIIYERSIINVNEVQDNNVLDNKNSILYFIRNTTQKHSIL